MPDVSTPSPKMAAMAADIELARTLMGGTAAMRAAGTRYLPRWPNEAQESYDCRLAVATLFPAYSRTVQTLTGKPFSKPIAVNDDVPPQIQALLPAIDSEGRELSQFAAQAMQCALAYGLAGILVDFPRMDGVQTLADQRNRGARPYFVLIDPGQIVGFRTVRDGAMWRLSQLRLREHVSEPDGDHGERVVEQIRVLEPGRWEVWRKAKNDVWMVHEEGASSLKEIPFVPVYGAQDGFMDFRPPLLEVAHLNVQHWQSASDQQTLLHIARVPILTVIGANDDTVITVGAASAVKLPQGSDMKFVEHSGAAISAGRQDLIDLEERMRQAGAELLVLAPGKVTATQIATENAVGMCALQRITLGLQDSLNTALQLMADWMNLPAGGTVTLFSDFGAATLAEASAELLFKVNLAGKLSDQTFLAEMQRRGILAPGVTADDERDRIEGQGPTPGDPPATPPVPPHSEDGSTDDPPAA